MTSFYSLDITLVLLWWIIKQIIRKKNLVTGEWSQSKKDLLLFGFIYLFTNFILTINLISGYNIQYIDTY